MRGRKVIFLAIAFMLPVSIFLFLKFFGKNEFEVAPLFQQPDEAPSGAGCEGEYSFPYVIPDSVNVLLQIPAEVKLIIFQFISISDPGRGEIMRQMNRVKDEFSNENLSFILLTGGDTGIDADLLRRCIFLMKPGQSVVMIDRSRRIRGQYVGESLEEMDRMIVEIKIILNKY